MARSNNLQVRISSDTSQFDAGVRRAERELQNFSKAAKSALSVVGIASFSKALGDATQTIANFERANSELAAVLGTDLKGVENLTNAAKQLGRTSEYTASEVTQLQISLSRLGFSPGQIEAMQGSVLNFALAMNTDLASAADFTGSALRAFGLAAEDTGSMLDVMSAATTNSALDFSKLQTSIGTVAPIANAFGLDVKETAAFLGVLANNGFDASTAATALRNILLNLSDSNGKLATGLGHSAKSFDEIISAFQELSDKGVEVDQVLEMTDKKSAAAAVTIIKQAGAVAELKAKLDGAEGSLDKMADTMSDNLVGSVRALKSAWEGFILELEESKGPIKAVVDGLTDILNRMTDIISAQEKITFSEMMLGPVTGGLIANARKKRKAANTPVEEEYVVPGGSGGGGRIGTTTASVSESLENASTSTTKLKGNTDKATDAMKALTDQARAAAAEAAEIAAADAEVAEAGNELYEDFRRMKGLTTEVFSPDEMAMYNEQLQLTAQYWDQINRAKPEEGSYAWVQNYTMALEDLNQGLNDAAMTMGVTMAGALGSLIGDLATGGDAMGNFANTALSAFGDMAVQVGKMMIEFGIGAEGIRLALTKLDPVVAIAAGAALVALGSAVRSGLANIATGSYSAGANVASSSYNTGGNDFETRDLNIHVTGKLQADGDQLTAVINNTNNRNGYTT